MKWIICLVCLCTQLLWAKNQQEPTIDVKEALVAAYQDNVRKNVLTQRELQTAKEILPFLLQNQLFKGYVQEELAEAVSFVVKEIDSSGTTVLPKQALNAVVMDMLHLLIPQYPMTVMSLRLYRETVSVVLAWPENPTKRMVVQATLPEEYMDLIQAMQTYSSQFGEPYFKLLGLILYLVEQENRSVDVSGDVAPSWNQEEERQVMTLEHLFGAHQESSRKEQRGLRRKKSRIRKS